MMKPSDDIELAKQAVLKLLATRADRKDRKQGMRHSKIIEALEGKEIREHLINAEGKRDKQRTVKNKYRCSREVVEQAIVSLMERNDSIGAIARDGSGDPVQVESMILRPIPHAEGEEDIVSANIENENRYRITDRGYKLLEQYETPQLPENSNWATQDRRPRKMGGGRGA